MKKKTIVKIAVFIFIAVLLLLIGHYFIHGFERDQEHCLLCDLLTIGLPSMTLYEFLLLFLLIIRIPRIKIISLSLLLCLQIQMRAPPYHSNI